jgi:hypothetical protein
MSEGCLGVVVAQIMQARRVRPVGTALLCSAVCLLRFTENRPRVQIMLSSLPEEMGCREERSMRSTAARAGALRFEHV